MGRFYLFNELISPFELSIPYGHYFDTMNISDCSNNWVILDTKCEMQPIHLKTRGDAVVLLEMLNKLSEKKMEKPKPLKDEILEALTGIDASKYDMLNKIKKQKEHIKHLEKRIRFLKRDNQSLQRSYCKQSTTLQQIRGEKEYFEKECMELRQWGKYL